MIIKGSTFVFCVYRIFNYTNIVLYENIYIFVSEGGLGKANKSNRDILLYEKFDYFSNIYAFLRIEKLRLNNKNVNPFTINFLIASLFK